jgi:hypothetical protein
LDFFGEQEGVWIRKYVVVRRPYILIYSSEKDMVRAWEGGGRLERERGERERRE